MGKGLKSNNKNTAQLTAGFSLIEAAIALAIIGVIVTPLFIIYNNEVRQRQASANLGKFTEIISNVNKFVAENNRYPLPADLFLGPTDADFGKEYAGTIADCAGWPTPDGVCKFNTGTNAVLAGAVPFAALGMNPDFAHDYWDNKILYAVMETQATAYDNTNTKTITLKGYDISGNIVTLPVSGVAKTYEMILVSFGSNGRGGYNREGNLILPCSTGTPELEEENCNMDNIFVARSHNTDPSFWPPQYLGTASYVNGPAYFDDFLKEQESFPRDYWLQNTADPAFVLTLSERVGIGTTNPEGQVHVKGAIKANRAASNKICNWDPAASSECFDPVIIYGNEASMDCRSYTLTDDTAVLSIASSQVNCVSPVNSTGVPIEGLAFELPAAWFPPAICPGAQRMSGFDLTTGGVKCN